ncbi:hypothetical protein [Alloyangia pacifica]|uniref:hypothetical protein n=1 Tax=Alloyangia pacifica TaxID=311180 RepID=UPI0031D10C13
MRNWASLAVILSLGVLLALSSVVSAARMAPDRETVKIEAYALLYGSSIDELCGDEAGHDHHCPLCHGLPEAPSSAHDDRHVPVEPHDAWHRCNDLHRAAQARNLCHSPRAPPVCV